MTTTDISLELLLGPQLEAFAAAGYEVVGVSAPGPVRRRRSKRRGIRHVPLAARHAVVRARRRCAGAGRAGVAVPPAAARDRAHAQPEARALRPGRGADRARAGRRQHRARPVRATRRPARAKRAMVYGDRTDRRRCARTPSSCRTPKTSRRSRGIGVPARKLTLLGNGIDLARFDPADDAPTTTRRPRARARRMRSRRRGRRPRRPPRAREGLRRGVRRPRAGCATRSRACGSR